MMRALVGLLVVLFLGLRVAPARAQTTLEKVRVLVPDRDNLQYMSFWLAKAAGYLADEKIEVDLVVPPGPQQTEAFFERREADVAVLPPPVYLGLIANKVRVVLVANLLENDPIELVVRRSVLDERKLSKDLPLRARLEGLRGVRLGVAPHPPTRLRALYRSQGLDADKDLTIVTLHGKEQNSAFHAGEVDALYAHTPFLERAIVADDALVLVDQCAGEVPELAHRQIHALAVNRSLLETRRELVVGFVRAIARAQALVHRSQPEAVAALMREMPRRERREIETIVRLYERALPASPEVRADRIPGAIVMFPAGLPAPDLSGIDLAAHVAPELVATPPPKTERRWALVIGIVVVVVLASAVLVFRRRTA